MPRVIGNKGTFNAFPKRAVFEDKRKQKGIVTAGEDNTEYVHTQSHKVNKVTRRKKFESTRFIFKVLYMLWRELGYRIVTFQSPLTPKA